MVRNLWVFSVSGGIGQAFAKEIKQRYQDCKITGFARNLDKVEPGLCQSLIAYDLTQPEQFADVIAQANIEKAPDYVLIAGGWLHDDKTMPEKTYRHLDAMHMQKSYLLNAVGPSLIIKALLDAFGWKNAMKVGVLSARLGSISDNKLGGWHSYRASKSALNMLIKNYAIELKMKQSSVVVFAIQPGTTDTPLSQPFQKGLPSHQLQTPKETAQYLVELFGFVEAKHSGCFLDFEHNNIET